MEDEPARLNVSRDLFEDSVENSICEDPYHFSQLGAGLATQTALALSISEVKFIGNMTCYILHQSLRYESSTLILYKELSSTIFQSL